MENGSYKVLYDFNIFTDRARFLKAFLSITHNTLIRNVLLISLLSRTRCKGKIDKHMDLPIELQWVWGTILFLENVGQYLTIILPTRPAYQ